MSNELTLEEIEKIVNQTKFDNSYYVYFDVETGNITQVSNKLLSDENYIRVEYFEIKDIIDGKEPLTDYKVIIDLKTKKYGLQSFRDFLPQSFLWNEFVYKIPLDNSKIDNADIVFEQNKNKNKWVIKFSKEVYQLLLDRKTFMSLEELLHFYITEEDDMNILIETVKFKISEINENREFILRSNSASQSVSVYCRKIFDTYSHIIK